MPLSTHTTSHLPTVYYISHLQQAADKQCTHKPAAASWQVFILTSGVCVCQVT